MSLTDAQVTAIRTSGFTDNWWADKLRVTTKRIRAARIGRTHSHIPTPPDIAPRDGTGRRTHGGPVRARPARMRRQWSWE